METGGSASPCRAAAGGGDRSSASPGQARRSRRRLERLQSPGGRWDGPSLGTTGIESWGGGGRWWRGNPSPTLPWNVTGNERGGVDGLARGGVGRLGRRRRLTGGGGMSKTLTLAAAGGGGGEGFLKRRRGAERNGDGSGWGKRSVEGKVVDDDWPGVFDSRGLQPEPMTDGPE
jgi:hypothetical protein